MSRKIWIVFFFCLCLLAALIVHPVRASSQAQVAYQTPTALADGRIIYVVQAKDSCLRIQLLTGVKVDQLILLNKLDQNCTIAPGKELILVIITPQAKPTLNPAITATPLLPTPTPIKGTGQICVQLYKDANGNGFQEDGEALMDGGVTSIVDSTGKFSKTGSTSSDPKLPYCENVPEGEYHISMGTPDGYNATTVTARVITVQAGDIAYVPFGAQVSSKSVAVAPAPVPPAAAPTAPDPSRNLTFAIVGGLFLLVGLGLGIYVLVMKR